MKRIAYVSLGFITLIWGLGFIFVDIGLREINPSQFMFYRFFFAVLALLIALNKKVLTILSKELKYGTILGVILYISFYLQTEGLKLSTPTKNAFLTSTYVVFVPILAYMFERKRISKIKTICIIWAIIGSAIMVLNTSFTLGIGDILSLACAVAFALQIYLTNLYIGRCRIMILVFVQMVVVMVLSLLFALPHGIPMPTDLKPITLAMILCSGLLATALSYLIQTWAQKYINETTTALILSMESVVGMISSVIILHEHITSKMILGACMILMAVILCEAKIKLPKFRVD